MLRIGPINSIKLVIDYYSAWFNVKGVKKTNRFTLFNINPSVLSQKLTKNFQNHV